MKEGHPQPHPGSAVLFCWWRMRQASFDCAEEGPDMPKYSGVCPGNVEIDIYSGCSFGCVYCIAGSRHSSESLPASDIDKIMDDAGSAGASSLPYYLSPWTDAYQHREADALLARNIVGALAGNHAPFFIITKSSLVMRDAEFLADRENAFVAVSLNTVDDEILKRLEPNAPGAEERRDTIRELLSTGKIRTVVKIDPVIPGVTNGERLDELTSLLCEIKPYAVTVETLRLTEDISAKLKNVLSELEYNRMMKFYPPLCDTPVHPRLEYRLGLFRKLALRFRENGIRASFCKASLPYPITRFDCRGGY